MRFRLAFAALLALSLARCAFPHGSMARPVQAPSRDALMFSGGVMVPFAAAVGAGAKGDVVGVAGTTQTLFLVPHTSIGYPIGDTSYMNLELSSWTTLYFSDPGGSRPLFVFLNPSFEFPFDKEKTVSLTLDGNFGYVRTGSGDERTSAPFFAPTMGVRWYIPVSEGGVIVSQQFGTGFISFALPGSLAFDVPIAIGEDSKLHIFPEVRWDPAIIYLDKVWLGWVFFSGGLSFMLEI